MPVPPPPHCTAPEGTPPLSAPAVDRLVTDHRVSLTQIEPSTWSYTCTCGFVCEAVVEAGFKAQHDLDGGAGA